MKFYEFGTDNPLTILLLPGTKCYWKNNLEQVIPLLEENFHVIFVSYAGFDETERTTYPDTITEAVKIEAYIKEHFNGKIDIAYGVPWAAPMDKNQDFQRAGAAEDVIMRMI